MNELGEGRYRRWGVVVRLVAQNLPDDGTSQESIHSKHPRIQGVATRINHLALSFYNAFVVYGDATTN